MWFKCIFALAIISSLPQSVLLTSEISMTLGQKGLINKYSVDSRVTLSFDDKINKFICKVNLLAITGDMSYIVKKDLYSELIYGIAKFGKSEKTDEYSREILNNRSLNFNYTYTKMDYNDNGEYYCIVSETKVMSKPIVINKDLKTLHAAIESNGEQLKENVYYHNEKRMDLICRVQSYQKANLYFYQSEKLIRGLNSTTEVVTKEDRRKLSVFETTINVTVDLKDKSFEFKCKTLIDKEVTDVLFLNLNKRAPVTINCSPNEIVAKLGEKVNVRCVIKGGNDVQNSTYLLAYKILNGGMRKLNKSEGYITITTIKKENELVVGIEIETRKADFRTFTFVANVNKEILKSQFTLTKDPKSENIETSENSASLFGISVLTLLLSLFLSLLN